MYAIVKLADTLDAMHFIKIKGQDTSQNKKIVARLNTYIKELLEKASVDFPEFDWSGFNRVQDELFNGSSAKEVFEDLDQLPGILVVS